ncbi:hypothetical protein S83_004005 [Arachis hypogaea]
MTTHTRFDRIRFFVFILGSIILIRMLFYITVNSKKKNFKRKRKLHQPGIEPGSVPWQGTILPLDHWCLDAVYDYNICKI